MSLKPKCLMFSALGNCLLGSCCELNHERVKLKLSSEFVPQTQSPENTQLDEIKEEKPQNSILWMASDLPNENPMDYDIDFEEKVQSVNWILFFPDYKDCPCCRGFVQNCPKENPDCNEMDECCCVRPLSTYEEVFECLEFYPEHKDCECCKGFVGNCSNKFGICKDLNECLCYANANMN